MQVFLDWLWLASWQGAVLAGIVAIVGMLPRSAGITPRWRTALWIVVLARLLAPALPQSRLNPGYLTRPLWDHPSPPETVMDITPTPVWKITYDSAAPVTSPRPLPPPISPPPPASPTTMLFLLWSAGAALLAIRFIAANISLSARIRRSSHPIDAPTTDLLAQCCRQLNLSPPRIRITTAVDSPALTGVLRPALLLPPNLPQTLTPAQLRLVLLHELAHLASRDLWIDWLWTAAQVLHWFNPMVWLARQCHTADRELARDAAVLTVAGPQASEQYGQTILRLAALSTARHPLPGLVGILDGKSRLHNRIALIATFNPPARISLAGVLALTLLAIAGLTAPPADSAPTTSPSATSFSLVLQVYDVRDILILMQVPDTYPGDRHPTPAAATQAARQTVPALPTTRPKDKHAARVMLMQMIMDQLGPAAWRDPAASIEYLDSSGEFVIRQSPDNHRKIDDFLNSFRHAHGSMVTISVRFLTLDPPLSDSLRQKLNLPDPTHTAMLSAAEARNLLKGVSVGRSNTELSAPRVTLFDGGRATVSVQRRTDYVASLTLPKGAKDYIPQTQPVSDGIKLDVRADVSSDKKYVTVDADVALSALDGFATIPFIAPDGSHPGDVQTPIQFVVDLHSLVSIPDGQTFILADKLPDNSATQPTLVPASTQPAWRKLAWGNSKIIYLLLTPQILDPYAHDATRPK